MTIPLPLPPVRRGDMLSADGKKITRTTITLTWKIHPSRPLHQVERREDDDPWEMIGIIPGPVFIDPDCDPGTTYVYKVTAKLMGASPDLYDMLQVSTWPETQYPGEREFFHQYLSSVFARDPKAGTPVAWCPKWYQHREAAVVVRELWRSYEAHYPPNGVDEPGNETAQWLINYAYPLLDRLWLQDTVFRGCDWPEHRPRNQVLPEE